MYSFYFLQIRVLKASEKMGTLRVKVRSIMETLITYELAMQYTWTGKAWQSEGEIHYY